MECWETTSACSQYGGRVNETTYGHSMETPNQQSWHYLGGADDVYEHCYTQPSAGWHHWTPSVQQTTFDTPTRCGDSASGAESDCCYRPRQNMTSKRNERERNRVRHINSTFGVLQRHLPGSTGKTKKLSKVDTLHAAVKYIKYLQDILSTDHVDWSPSSRSGPDSPPTSTASSSPSSSRASSPLSQSLSPASCDDTCREDSKPLYVDLHDSMNALL